jgi:hypothetical protein
VEEFEIGSPKITLNTDRGEDVTFNSLISCIAKRDLYG